MKYRTRAIITRGLYNFYPIFLFHCSLYYRYLCTKNENSSFFKPKIRGLYTRAVTDQEQAEVALYGTCFQLLCPTKY